MATKNHYKLGTYKTGAEYAISLPRNLTKENVMTNIKSKKRTTTFLIGFLTLLTFNLASFQVTTAYADTILHKHNKHNNAVNKIKNSANADLRQLNQKKSKNAKNQNASNFPQARGKKFTINAQKKNQLSSHSMEIRRNKNKKGNISPILIGNNGGQILTDPHSGDQSGAVEQPSSDSHSGNSLGADYPSSNDPTSSPVPVTPADDLLGNASDQGTDLFPDGGPSIIDPVVSDFPEFDTPIPGDLVPLFDLPDNGGPTNGPTISALNIDPVWQPVPEPSTLFLIGAGLMAFGLMGKRFRK
jgi:hypothetical protein